MKNSKVLLLAVLILFALSGCGSITGLAKGNTPTPIQPTLTVEPPFLPTLTPEFPTAPVVIVGTAVAVGPITPAPLETLPAGTPPPITFPPGGGLIVGLQDQGRTVIMHVGDRFLLQLGEVFDWTVTSSDDTVVGRVVNITVIRGAQGLYEGRKPGEATINAIGDPLCRSSKPACMLPSVSYTIHVQVEP